MKKNLIKKAFMTCLTVMVFLCLPLSSNAEEDDVNSLKEQITILESENEDLQETIDQLQSENTELQAKVEELGELESISEPEALVTDEPEVEKSDDDIQVLEEYTLADGIGWYTRHFMVVRNNTNETLSVSSQSLAYSPNGELVSVGNGSIKALGAGCTTVFYEAFETDEEIETYETTITTSESRSYESVLDDLSYIETDISGGAIFQVTNEGDEAAEYVKGYVLFILNGELVDYDDTYFSDDDNEIKPGDTITKQITAYSDYDTIEFYMDGRRQK